MINSIHVLPAAQDAEDAAAVADGLAHLDQALVHDHQAVRRILAVNIYYIMLCYII